MLSPSGLDWVCVCVFAFYAMLKTVSMSRCREFLEFLTSGAIYIERVLNIFPIFKLLFCGHDESMDKVSYK